MENIAWLTECAVCGSDKGEFSEEFMEVICSDCTELNYHRIAVNVMRHKNDEYEKDNKTHEEIIANIFSEVEKITKITIQQAREKTRKPDVVEARNVAMVAVKNRTKIPYRIIAWEIGRLDHSTLNHAILAVQKRIDTEKSFFFKYRYVLGL